MNSKDRDTFGLLFRNTFINYLGAEFHPYIHLTWAEHQEHTVAFIHIDPSPKPVYLTDKKQYSTEFYIRAGNQTKLSMFADPSIKFTPCSRASVSLVLYTHPAI